MSECENCTNCTCEQKENPDQEKLPAQENWTYCSEEGLDYWINEKLGNIFSMKNVYGQDEYYCQVPKIIGLGPFESLNEAKEVMEKRLVELSELLKDFNGKLVNK